MTFWAGVLVGAAFFPAFGFGLLLIHVGVTRWRMR